MLVDLSIVLLPANLLILIRWLTHLARMAWLWNWDLIWIRLSLMRMLLLRWMWKLLWQLTHREFLKWIFSTAYPLSLLVWLKFLYLLAVKSTLKLLDLLLVNLLLLWISKLWLLKSWWPDFLGMSSRVISVSVNRGWVN